MSYPAYSLPAGTTLPVPTEADNGTRDIAFVAGRLAAGEPWTVITLHRSSFRKALFRIQAAGGTVPGYDIDDILSGMGVLDFDAHAHNNNQYKISSDVARSWNLRDGFIKNGGVA